MVTWFFSTFIAHHTHFKTPISFFTYPSHTYISIYYFTVSSIPTHSPSPVHTTTLNGPHTTIHLYPTLYPINLSPFPFPYLHGTHDISQHGKGGNIGLIGSSFSSRSSWWKICSWEHFPNSDMRRYNMKDGWRGHGKLSSAV